MPWTVIDSIIYNEAAKSNFHLLVDALSLEELDHQLIWADLTFFKAVALATNKQRWSKERLSSSPISVIFEIEHGIEPEYVKILGDSTLHSGLTYFTGFVAAADLLRFACTVKRFRIGMTEEPLAAAFDQAPDSSAYLKPLCDENEIVLGLIDHGFAFVNKNFLKQYGTKTTTRIETLWDQQYGYPVSQNQIAGMSWQDVPRFGYGRELSNTSINTLINSMICENDVYLREAYDPVLRARAHGTHVMSLAAGALENVDDNASKAPIIAVQLPAKPFKDTSGQNLCVQVLNAVHYILAHAQGRKVVINISDGAYAGPHDGTSMLESAIDELLAKYSSTLKIVVAAGNQFEERIHWQETIKSNKLANLNWRILPDDKTDSFCEIWFDKNLSAENAKKIVASVISPSGQSVDVILGQTAILRRADAISPEAAVTFANKPPNANNRMMLHFAIAPTTISRKSNAKSTAEHGVWQINLLNNSKNDLNFDAYIERDNPALGDKGPRRQSYFIHPAYPRDNRCMAALLDDSKNMSPIKRMGALNNLATGERVIVAGSYVAKTGQIAKYSASGPGRKNANSVDCIAPSDKSLVVRGISGFGVRTGSRFNMDGTSVAAPQIARALINGAAFLPVSHTPATLGPLERVGLQKL